jgi:hypothetical protein
MIKKPLVAVALQANYYYEQHKQIEVRGRQYKLYST